ncbi:MAG: hemolysin family protein, partial [Dehalococcoidales bacterium]|nr:hemolysin family protein [Dehalococcoidales bacterium]
GSKQGVVKAEEAELLHNVFEFAARPVREIMVTRTDVVAAEEGTSLADFLNMYTESPKSRFPVYQDSMNNVIGVIAIKDVLMALSKESLSRESPIDELVRPAYFAPESKRIGELFAEMRDQNQHMTIVIDEYGGTAGIVTLSRLLEELVGPVSDELAEAPKEYETINENTFQVDGAMRIDEANEQLELGIPEGEYETLAGFVLHRLGHIPKQGEQLRYRDLKIVVTQMRSKKIEEVLITREHAASTD